ncbi:RHS repeat-associated core domain-containing protein [Bordetella sp. LUAb4]|uniref:RHS repeat-associated core domain-containing protein n=1 Tax=Bordetella sp. LUAb4 TaxID=2843195 RepID=UPI001E4AEBDF|nr:RHS repeat-associated core domain-containing protein [Bordetella sp. LUAb4]
MASVNVYSGTPLIRVHDNRGLAVRTLRYNRSVPDEVAAQLVECNAFNALGQSASSQDARFFAQGSLTLNFQHTPTLSGHVLQTVSADAGQTQTFNDIAGRPIRQRDARGTIQQFTYDALSRPLTRTETLEGKSDPAVRERWIHGDAATPAARYDASDKTDARNLNQRGQVVQRYDTAGLLDTRGAGYTVPGAPQRQDRTLLPAEATSDWTDEAVAHWPATLTAGTTSVYATSWAYNALSQVLGQTDAKGHLQNTSYDIAGRKNASSVTPNGGQITHVTTSTTYTASGQMESKVDANGVTTGYSYEPQTTQRVLTIKVTRGMGASTTVLQDLSYTYDPVGNVTTLNDGAQAIAFFKNRAVSAARTYTYDALYQLISASGRENAAGTPSGTDSPQAFAPLNVANYRPYTRRYAYDLGGNLTQIAPGNSLPTRNMTVAATSNRAVSNANAQSVTAATVGTYFDAAGNANCLDGNSLQPMRWTGLNQLQRLVTSKNGSTNPAAFNRESYAYGGDGQRVRKTAFAQTSGAMQQSADAIYLPGLELRVSGNEALEVIVLDDGARVLNWTANKPSDIANRQLRYQYRERQGSCQIETDDQGAVITQEEYYPYGGTAVWASRSTSEATYKTIRYSGKERDAAGLYYYGLRYYQPWIGRWVSTDPAGTVDGLNLYCMVGNNPITRRDLAGLVGEDSDDSPPMKRAKLASISETTLPGSSAGAQPATIDPDLLDFLIDLDRLSNADFNEKKQERSTAALESQEEDIDATHEEIEEGAYEFDEAKRGHYESEQLSAAIQTYTLESSQPNRYLREGSEQGATSQEISDTKSLALHLQTAIEALPSRSKTKPPLKIYRAVTTETTDQYPHSGLEVGDVLISQDFLSFTENPYVLTEFSEALESGKIIQTAYFIAPNAPSAKPISPFAEDPEEEAEHLVPMGIAFQVESIGKFNHNGHEFTQIMINEVNGFHISEQRALSDAQGPSALNGRRVLNIGTGEPFDLSELHSRLGEGIDHIVRRYAPK